MKFYKCSICGKMIAVINDSEVPTFCCGKEMEVIPYSTNEQGPYEKHMPVLEVKDNVATVKVGSITHPSTPEHFIEWIFIETNKGNKRVVLKPGDVPEASFALLEGEKIKEVLSYCNLHGLYKLEAK